MAEITLSPNFRIKDTVVSNIPVQYAQIHQTREDCCLYLYTSNEPRDNDDLCPSTINFVQRYTCTFDEITGVMFSAHPTLLDKEEKYIRICFLNRDEYETTMTRYALPCDVVTYCGIVKLIFMRKKCVNRIETHTEAYPE